MVLQKQPYIALVNSVHILFQDQVLKMDNKLNYLNKT